MYKAIFKNFYDVRIHACFVDLMDSEKALKSDLYRDYISAVRR